MITSIVFATLNVVASFVIFTIVVYKLTMKADSFTPIERIGLGLTAAGAILTVGPVTFTGSPFDSWSGVLMRVGMAIYFVGRLTRHSYNNWMMRRIARRRFQG